MSKKDLDHLYLTKNERIGIIILFILLFLFIILPRFYFTTQHPSEIRIDDKKSIAADDKYDSSERYPDFTKGRNIKSTNDAKIIMKTNDSSLFEFDPNDLEPEKARKLGISDKSYRILQKYLATGARIKTAIQFSKIYGIDEKTFRKLEPYIRLKNTEPITGSLHTAKNKLTPGTFIDLNGAAEEDFRHLPGIGEKLASRIIKYRNLIGGFTDKSQLKEIYGLQDSTIQKIIPYLKIHDPIRKLNINNADYETMSKHPYIGYKTAKVICEYRKQHHKFENANDLLQLAVADSNWVKRILAYLEFE